MATTAAFTAVPNNFELAIVTLGLDTAMAFADLIGPLVEATRSLRWLIGHNG